MAIITDNYNSVTVLDTDEEWSPGFQLAIIAEDYNSVTTVDTDEEWSPGFQTDNKEKKVDKNRRFVASLLQTDGTYTSFDMTPVDVKRLRDRLTAMLRS
ncbi:MAG: hypothetical protein ACR2QF_12165 [Geminicoccaceae bacterium]